MNTRSRIEEVCGALGLRFSPAGHDSIIIRFGPPTTSIVVQARDLVVKLDRPCGIVLQSALPAAIQEANRLNAEIMPMGAFTVRERDRLLSFGLALIAPTGLTPEQLDIGLAAVVLNPFAARFAPFLEQTLGDLDCTRWWNGAA
ncbi:MAG: hypothetical protein RMM58_09495 [Chloroflexota bacterium]|nr:YbjN domain-containing protein [Dehalococcoidia bacterium]MDW8254101.1 hypothetical protein [Chloroflexota bacterium]